MILTHCGVAYKSVRSLARGHMIRVWFLEIQYNWKKEMCNSDINQ